MFEERTRKKGSGVTGSGDERKKVRRSKCDCLGGPEGWRNRPERSENLRAKEEKRMVIRKRTRCQNMTEESGEKGHCKIGKLMGKQKLLKDQKSESVRSQCTENRGCEAK